ncbi:LolA family protein [Desulfurispira natronophila]|uniref:Outer membrane lipoprotein carrier protein n=1 Tax=Desulfurispira natronophila TaxID=682562 RepID=A0A7W7Y5J3_9BACT|nr:outer membrane lipoprotein carrier protein LolA [Desulfurispira natronophila]MBB5022476.1 outer membrane lipoprotein carrier protein [Desulfurispira natronophila]
MKFFPSIRRSLLLLALSISSLPALAQSTALDALSSYYSMRAAFEQETLSSDGFVQEGRGVFTISKNLEASLWEYSSPEPLTYLIRNHQLWLYLHDEQELNIMDISEYDAMGFSMLDRSSMEKAYHVLENSSSTVVLESKEEPITTVTITIRDNMPESLIVQGSSLDTTTIDFLAVEMNVDIDPELFQTREPQGWEVIRQ